MKIVKSYDMRLQHLPTKNVSAAIRNGIHSNTLQVRFILFFLFFLLLLLYFFWVRCFKLCSLDLLLIIICIVK